MVSSIAKTETRFGEIFKRVVADENDAAFAELRKAAYAEFASNGFPTVKNEDWKYTNVGFLAGLDWEFVRIFKKDEKLDESVRSIIEGFNFHRNGFAALNLALGEVAVVRIPKETVIEKPITFEFSAEPGTAIFPRIVVIAEAGSKATLVERFTTTGKSFTNSAVQIVVEDNSNLTHYRIQHESAEAFNYGVTEIKMGRASSYNSTNINLGGALSRHDMDLKFAAEGAEAWVDGLYMLNGEQHHDTHSIIDHLVPNCTSHQNYKGVLNDRSRAVFNGKVFVRLDASGTDAIQSNKNLLLSNDARVDTKPQLEIFNDDVKCAHGATVGQLEDEELFYLLTRGLPPTLARNLLTYGFAEEVINKIEIDEIKNELNDAVLNRIGTTI
jgi:Fe-S cluster assembly protein SufD